MKRKLLVLLMTFSMITLTACGKGEAQPADTAGAAAEEKTAEASAEETAVTEEENAEPEAEDIVIVYTNDVHSYIDNVVKDDDGNITGDGLRFSKVAALVADKKANGENVILVDAGDEIQGCVYGAMDEGLNIINIMNATGYELATIGNHEFDYGTFRLFELIDKADYPFVSCNFRSAQTKDIVLPPSKIFEIGGKKIAIIGVTTPETITASTPTYFQNEKGEYIYTIDGIDDNKDLYASVQSAIDSVRDEADYVIALGHCGVGADSVNNGTASTDIIGNTSGLDAFIDGHSHTTMEGDKISDKDGKEVILTQTGCYLSAVGVMTISKDGNITTELLNDYDREDEKVAGLEKEWIDYVTEQLGEEIGVLDTTLYICDPDNENRRLIRAQEMNSGDFAADSMYWFFNEKLDKPCDIAIQNGGGVRAQTEKGSIDYLAMKNIMPFGNMVCMISGTGQEILDALEMGVNVIGVWDNDWDSPAENGGFLHVAGMKYTVDASVPSSVETDGSGSFIKVDGDYRVKDVEIYNRESGEYEPIDLSKNYNIAGINYMLRNGGSGLSMFTDNELIVDYVDQDYLIASEYVKSFAKNSDGIPEVNTKNSPLSAYNGYLLDYENPFGAGRISIENLKY